MSRAAESRTKLDKLGVDEIIEMITEDGSSLRGIANEVGVSIAALLNWIAAEPDRSARVREARAGMAKLWDEKAEDMLRQAEDEFGLKKAKELAHHYRWRASKTAPKEYGDQVEVKGSFTLEQLVAGSMARPEQSDGDA